MVSGVETVARVADVLGETPIWLARRACVAWIDASRCLVHVLDVRADLLETLAVDSPGPLGGIAQTADERRLVLAAPGVVGTFDLDGGDFAPVLALDARRDDIVCNDAKVDAAGRLWVGTCERAEREPRGAIYRIDADGRAELFDAGFVVPNGPAFSSNGTTVYVSDTMAGRILAYDVDEKGAQRGPRRVFADLAPTGGMPDGLTVDRAGNVWCGLWGGGGIACLDPSGAVIDRIALPATNVTSLVFGGEDFRDLYITSARTGLDDVALAAEPLAGSLFRIRSLSQGMAERPWAELPAAAAHTRRDGMEP